MGGSDSSDSESSDGDLGTTFESSMSTSGITKLGLNSPKKAKAEVQDSLQHWYLQRNTSAAYKLQRQFRRKKKRRAKAIDRITAWYRGKQGRLRALRAWELDLLVANRRIQCMRCTLQALCYILLVIFTGFAMFVNLIFGIKFAEGEQVGAWIQFTLLTILIDWVLYSPIKIICRWFMPLFLVVICYVLFFFGIVGF